jgi:hypothetical protein
VPEHITKRNLVPPLRALLPLIASSGGTALSAELRLARRYRAFQMTTYIEQIAIENNHSDYEKLLTKIDRVFNSSQNLFFSERSNYFVITK